MTRSSLIGAVLALAASCHGASPDAAGATAGAPLPLPPKEGVRLFYRMLGSQSNGPLPWKTRSIAARDGEARTATTGMADSGFTEYPFCSGRWSFTFRERAGTFPRIASAVEIDPDRVNTADILLDFVYEPDGCVWGPACREFAQTFVASGRELVSVTVLVATERGTFRVALHQGGLAGREAAPRKTFVSGHSMEWGTARWRAGEAPLESGRTYCLRMWRDDGAAWTPYFHATGDVYDKGQAFLDGRPRAESDLALWIVEEPPEISRALVVEPGEAEWARGTTGVRFVPRTPNIRLISVEVGPARVFCVNLIALVYALDPDRRLVAGPKYCVACARPDSFYDASFLFGPDELATIPGAPYFVEVFPVPFEEGKGPVLPEDRSDLPARDLRAFVYGETQDVARATISNVTARFPGGDRLELAWRVSAPGPVMIESLSGEDRPALIQVPPLGHSSAVIENVHPGADIDVRLSIPQRVNVHDIGSPDSPRPLFATPLFRIRAPGGEPAPVLWPEHPSGFLPLAPDPRPAPAPLADPPGARTIGLPDGGFEGGMGAWRESRAGIGGITGAEAGIEPIEGARMYGFTHRAGAERRDVHLTFEIARTIWTAPGRWYELSAQAVTSVENGPRGDTRVCLAADPLGGMDLAGVNASQWYWTDGRWLRIAYRFQARGDRATIAVGLYRWRDLDRASAYVDDVRVAELATAPPPPRPSPPPPRGTRIPRER
ncbi:MAG: hypothetical protein JXP34_10860 [Planctomycetes bacterium]|nr:hypothetical protein [Planctomycetota bacterium]